MPWGATKPTNTRWSLCIPLFRPRGVERLPDGLQRPGQVVYWLQQVLGVGATTKEFLSSPTEAYVHWVEIFAGPLTIRS